MAAGQKGAPAIDPRTRCRRWMDLLVAVTVAMTIGACRGVTPRDRSADACGDGTPSLAAGAGSHALKTIFLIVMENHDWSSIAGSPSAPYINSALLPRFAHAQAYRNGDLHPSLASYIALEAGDPLGVTSDSSPRDLRLPVACHLVTWLEDVGLTWKSYQEGIDGNTCPLADAYPYTAHHDPFLYFDDITGDPPSAASARCIAHVRPYGELSGDLRAGTVARYSSITPDLCHDGHDSCGPQHDPVRQQDDWLASEIPGIMSSRAYQDGGVILVTWDEASADDHPVGLIAISPFAKAGYENAIPYSHASTVRTIQEILGLTPPLRRAATATSLADLFTTYP